MIILYSTGCPKCEVLKEKMEQKGVNYELCENTDVMKALGITIVPMLNIDGILFNFVDSVKYINNL